MCANSKDGLAESAWIEQIEIAGESSIGLDSFWRASGCPVGHKPHAWITLVGSLLEGSATSRSTRPGPPAKRGGRAVRVFF